MMDEEKIRLLDALCAALGWKLPDGAEGGIQFAQRVDPVDPSGGTFQGVARADETGLAHPSNIPGIVYRENAATKATCDTLRREAGDWMSKAVTLSDAIELHDTARRRLLNAVADVNDPNSARR